MKEENVFVIFSLLIIALAALALTGYMVNQQIKDAPLTALIMIPGSVVSGLVGYLAKGIVTKLKQGKEKEDESKKSAG